MATITRAFTADERAVDRRTVLKATAWAVPAVAIAVAVPTAAASGSGTGWVSAVRTGAHNQSPSLQPGFRFGNAETAQPVSAIVTFTTTAAGLSFADIFHSFSGQWDFAASDPIEVDGVATYTYTASKNLNVGPSTYYDTAYTPGTTAGITITGLSGTYSATVSPADGTHGVATFTY